MIKVSYEDLIDAVATRSGQSKNETRLVLEALERKVVEHVAAGDEVSMGSFGKFVRRERTVKTTKAGGDFGGPNIPVDPYKVARVDFISGEKTKRALNG